MIVRNVFDYIVDRILRWWCVFVAGVGIFMISKFWSGEWVYNVKWMVIILKKELFKFWFVRYKVEVYGIICKCWCLYEFEVFGYKIIGDICKGVCFFCDIIKVVSVN